MPFRYSHEQHREYLNMLDRVSLHWLKVFEGNTDFYLAAYWDLFTRIWKAGKPVKRPDALKFMQYIKSPVTARKYIEKAIQEGFLHEEPNPADSRSTLIRLSPEMQERLDTFFDAAVNELQQAHKLIFQKMPLAKRPNDLAL